MKIGVIADSHDHSDNIKKSLRIFGEKNVAYILHLGDFISPNSIKEFGGFKLIGIFGNNDSDKVRLISAFNEIGGEVKGDFYEFEADNLKFACYHGTDPKIVDAAITSQRYDIFLYGHIHQCVNKTIKKTMVLNPGTAHGFSDRATIMTFDTRILKAEFIDL
jgi:putative phosphoesterase